jgi:hypothetical protein
MLTRRTPAPERIPATSGVTVSGFASTVISTSGASGSSRRIDASIRFRRGGSSRVGVPPPKNTVSSGVRMNRSATACISASSLSTNAPCRDSVSTNE